MKKRISVIWVFVIVLSIVFSVGFSAAGEINIELPNNTMIKKNIFGNNNIPNTIKEKINQGWPLIYDNGNEDASHKVVIDSEENIVVTGYTFNAASYESDFLTVKYSNEGEEIWNASYDGGIFDHAWDLEVDSQDNIVVFGFNYSSIGDSQNFDFVFHLIKYNKDGIEQWSNSYSWEDENDSFPGGISVDSNDNIIMVGGYGDLNFASFYCWILKVDSNGDEIWNRTFDEDMVSIGFDAVTNSNDDIFVGGLSASFFGQGWYIVKYDSNGNKKWSQRYNDGNQMEDMEIDSKENIILTGQDYSSDTESSSWLTMKCDKNGNLLWKQEYDGIDNEYSQDAAIDSKDNVVTVGSIFGQDYYESCIIIYDEYGEEICMKKPSIDCVFEGVTIDKLDNVIATGSINNSEDSYNWDYYTCKFLDNLPPSTELEKPRLGYLYIFDKELIPLMKNTVIFGKITVKVIADSPSDVKKALFYLDGNLVETIDAPPYEWIWDSKTFANHNVEIHIYDENENINREIINVWKFF